MSDPLNTEHDPLMEGAGGPPGVKFEALGDSVTGVVLSMRERDDIDMDTNEVKTWPNGDPIKVYAAVLDVDGTEDGQRTLWIRGNMVKAVREAVTKAGVKSSIGHKLTVQHHEVGVPTRKGFNAPKLYRAKLELVIKPQTAAAAEEPWD